MATQADAARPREGADCDARHPHRCWARGDAGTILRMDPGASSLRSEIAQAAARCVVDEGLEFGPAKRRAIKQLGLPARTPLPGNDELEDAVREHIALFCADTQPAELAALRRLAATWMARLAGFRPYLAGPVWLGFATRRTPIHVDLFCDDPKSAEIALIDLRVPYDPHAATGLRGDAVDVLSLQLRCPALQDMVLLHLYIYDHDDLRGALRPDHRGRVPRGDLQAVQQLLEDGAPE